MTQAFDFAPLLRPNLPPGAARWTGAAKYNFTGGNNDGDAVPVDGLIAAATASLKREGRNLATYNLATGPQGYRPLREFLVGKLKRDASIDCTADDILLVSGSLQALDLVNQVLLTRGDTVICEQDTYQGTLTRFARLGVKAIGIPLDRDGLRMDALATALADCKARGVQVKMIYTIPTVQNPTATIMPETRRAELLRLAEQYGVAVFEDDCYADLIWDGKRPPSLYAMSKTHNVIHCGSFLQVDRAGAARRLPGGALGDHVAHDADEDRCGLRRGRADDAGRILHAAIRRPCSGAAQGAARQGRDADGGIERAVRHRRRVRRSQRRHLPVGEAARQCRHHEALPGRTEGRRRDQPRDRVVDRRQTFRRALRRSALPAPRSRRSAKASRSSPTCAAASSACRPGVRMWRSVRKGVRTEMATMHSWMVSACFMALVTAPGCVPLTCASILIAIRRMSGFCFFSQMASTARGAA